jgi:hypothetical protein
VGHHIFPHSAELKAKNHEIEKFQLRAFLTKSRLLWGLRPYLLLFPPESASQSNGDEHLSSRTGRRQSGADPIGSRGSTTERPEILVPTSLKCEDSREDGFTGRYTRKIDLCGRKVSIRGRASVETLEEGFKPRT